MYVLNEDAHSYEKYNYSTKISCSLPYQSQHPLPVVMNMLTNAAVVNPFYSLQHRVRKRGKVYS